VPIWVGAALLLAEAEEGTAQRNSVHGGWMGLSRDEQHG
jgi:hypothetical protein